MHFIRSSKFLSAALALSIVFASCKKDSVEGTAGQIPSIRPVTSSSNKYVTEVIGYTPAPGQFTNTAAGDSTAAASVVKSRDGFVSLGAWGGNIVLGFDHTVINRPDTADIMIYANASGTFAEPGIVWVMADDNGNGKADDTWYEVAGSEFNKPGYERNYSVTYTRPDSPNGDVHWKDNKGDTGVVKVNEYHTQPCYPDWIRENEYTLTGSRLPSYNIDDSNPLFITSTSFGFGYADDTLGGDVIDLDSAVDGNGMPAHLKGVDFIKIQTGIQYNMGRLGELSTEVTGVADISMGLD